MGNDLECAQRNGRSELLRVIISLGASSRLFLMSINACIRTNLFGSLFRGWLHDNEMLWLRNFRNVIFYFVPKARSVL